MPGEFEGWVGHVQALDLLSFWSAMSRKTLYLQQNKTVAEIGQLLGVGRATIYCYLAHLQVPTGNPVVKGAA